MSQIDISFVYPIENIEMEIQAFNKKIGSLRTDLLAIARTMTSMEADAEDDVQETLLRLWSMRDKLDAHPNTKALAISILKNIKRDKWRHLQYEHEFLANMEECRRSINNDNDDLELIGCIVETLPPLQSQIFKMKEIEGYGKDEIIQILGCSEENFRKNLSRARRRIREIYLKVNQI